MRQAIAAAAIVALAACSQSGDVVDVAPEDATVKDVEAKMEELQDRFTNDLGRAGQDALRSQARPSEPQLQLRSRLLARRASQGPRQNGAAIRAR